MRNFFLLPKIGDGDGKTLIPKLTVHRYIHIFFFNESNPFQDKRGGIFKHFENSDTTVQCFGDIHICSSSSFIRIGVFVPDFSFKCIQSLSNEPIVAPCCVDWSCSLRKLTHFHHAHRRNWLTIIMHTTYSPASCTPQKLTH